MDGVLVDSEDYWDENRRPILREAGVPEDFDELEVRGMNIEDQYEYLSDRFDLDVDRDGFIELYDRRAERIYYQESELLGCLEHILELVERNDLRLGLVSASPRRWVEMVLDRFELEETFDVVVTADDIDGPSKPDPAIYTEAAKELDARPEECVAVEDSENGLKSAKDAGMTTVGYRHPDTEVLEAADRVVESEEQLLPALKSFLA